MVHTKFTTDYMKPDPFPFIDFGLDSEGNQVYISWQAYVDRICDYLILCIYTGLIAYYSPIEKRALLIFFILQCIDLVDFLLFYNALWSTVFGIELSMNLFKMSIFGLIILRQWIKSFSAR